MGRVILLLTILLSGCAVYKPYSEKEVLKIAKRNDFQNYLKHFEKGVAIDCSSAGNYCWDYSLRTITIEKEGEYLKIFNSRDAYGVLRNYVISPYCRAQNGFLSEEFSVRNTVIALALEELKNSNPLAFHIYRNFGIDFNEKRLLEGIPCLEKAYSPIFCETRDFYRCFDVKCSSKLFELSYCKVRYYSFSLKDVKEKVKEVVPEIAKEIIEEAKRDYRIFPFFQLSVTPKGHYLVSKLERFSYEKTYEPEGIILNITIRFENKGSSPFIIDLKDMKISKDKKKYAVFYRVPGKAEGGCVIFNKDKLAINPSSVCTLEVSRLVPGLKDLDGAVLNFANVYYSSFKRMSVYEYAKAFFKK